MGKAPKGAVSTFIKKLAVSFGAVVVALLCFELASFLYSSAVGANSGSDLPPHVWSPSSPELYRNNPARPDIDEFGYRECSGVTVNGSESGPAVLVLGDSVVFGHGVECESAFPSLLQLLLTEKVGAGCAVYNAGVNGYNTYNEVGEYERFSGQENAEIVVLVTCLNDFVDPRLHWGGHGESALDIPAEAIPNKRYDHEVGKPVLESWRREAKLSKFATYRVFRRAVTAFELRKTSAGPGSGHESVTGEVDFPITALLDIDSPELRWYGNQLDRLQVLVEAQSARLLVALAPLEFQLEADYPHYPQALLSKICADKGIACIDLAPTFRGLPADEVFLGEHDGYNDLWHFSPAGHFLVAEALADFIDQSGWVGGGL